MLRRYGLQGRRVGLELGCWNLAPNDVSELQAQLPDLNIADATHLVALVAAVKSELEIETMRGSMADRHRRADLPAFATGGHD